MKLIKLLISMMIMVLAAGLSVASAESYIGLNLGNGSIDGYEDANSGFVYYGYGQPNWAVEAGVNPLGFYRFASNDSSIQIDGFEVDVLGKLPVNQRISAYAKAGYFFYTLKPEFSGVKLNELDGDTLVYGIGLMMDIGQTLKARVAYEIYDDVESLEASRLVFGIAAKIF